MIKSNPVTLQDAAARIATLESENKKLRAVVDAAKKHADATIQYRLMRIPEGELAGRYNNLMDALAALDGETK